MKSQRLCLLLIIICTIQITTAIILKEMSLFTSIGGWVCCGIMIINNYLK